MIFNPFQLKSTLTQSASSNLNDAFNTKKALNVLGYYKPSTGVVDNKPDSNLFKGIKSFQSAFGLKRDGVLKPGGETERAISTLLERKRNSGVMPPSSQPAKPESGRMPSLLDSLPHTSPSIMPGEHDWPKPKTPDIAWLEMPQQSAKQTRDIKKLLELISHKAQDNKVVAEGARTVEAALKTSDHTGLAKFHASAVKDFGDDALAEITEFANQLKKANPEAHKSWLSTFTYERPSDAKRMVLAGSLGENSLKGGVGDDTLKIEIQARLNEKTVGTPLRKPGSPVTIKSATPPFDNPVFRSDGEEVIGKPEFGAKRKNQQGEYDHRGVDLRAAPGKEVRSLVDGTVTKIGHAYSDGSGYRTVWVRTNDGHEVGLFYLTPHDSNGNSTISEGDTVKAGQVLGTMQNLTKKFPDMDNHLHLEIKKNGSVLDPSPWLKEWGVTYPKN